MLKNIRYKIVGYILKILTPNLYNRINGLSARVNDVPRPFISYLKANMRNDNLIGCEIGIGKGINALNILTELNIRKLYLIDSWKYKTEKGNLRLLPDRMNLPEIYGNTSFYFKKETTFLDKQIVEKLFEYDNRVIIINGFSNEVYTKINDNSLDFLYIDGGHRYIDVKNDLFCYYPKVRQNGIIAGHDSHWTDVLQAVIDFCYIRKERFFINYPDWYFIKRNKYSI